MQRPDWNRLKSPLFLGLISAVILGVLLGTITQQILEKGSLVRLDQWVLDHTAALQHPWLTPVMLFITNLGGSLPIWPMTFLSVFFLFVWKKRFESGFVAAVMFGGGILEQVLKHAIQRARPVPPSGTALTDAWGWSYPSGHAMISTLFYFTLAYLLWRRSGLEVHGAIVFGGAFLLSALIAFSRVYLQVHYLTDVAAGMLGGLLWVLVCAALAEHYGSR